METPVEAKLFINGEFVDASDKKTFDLHSPYSGDLVGKSKFLPPLQNHANHLLTSHPVSEATAQDVNTAVSAARAAQPAWEALSPQQKGAPLAKLAQLIKSNTKELARLDALSLGRPISTYFDSHYATTQFQYFSEAGYATGQSSLNTPGFLNLSIKQPYGVVAAIIPWNCPLIFLSKKLAPALAAGNTVLLKTSEKAPLSSHLVATFLNEAGFPPGVVNVLHGHGNISGAAMASHMQIRALSFTGSVRTGRAIQKAAADSNFKHLTFEMGGKSPAIIFEDAEIERAAKETQNSIFFHSGQTCFANSRIYVHDKIAEQVVEKFKSFAQARKMGDPLDPETTSGPQADRTQWENVQRSLHSAAEAGHTGTDAGTTLPVEKGDLFIPPTIFLNHPSQDSLSKNEIFGPVVIINTFSTEAEALTIANDTEYGLYAAVYTKDLDRAVRVAKGLESGMVGVNCTSPTGSWDLPFGGWKQSGIGRESLLGGLEEWMETKSVYMRVEGLAGMGAGGGGNSVLGR